MELEDSGTTIVLNRGQVKQRILYLTGLKIEFLLCTRRKLTMIETIAIILLILWLLGMITGNTLGGGLHIIIVVALIIFLVRLLTGRRVS